MASLPVTGTAPPLVSVLSKSMNSVVVIAAENAVSSVKNFRHSGRQADPVQQSPEQSEQPHIYPAFSSALPHDIQPL
jgi:hypothetical protein